MSFLARLVRLLSREPDFIIGGKENPYMLRWYVLPRNRWFNIYLHNILRSDDDRALHDHPWWNVSILLRGSYTEVVPDLSKATTPYTRIVDLPTIAKRRCGGNVVLRRAVTSHRLVIDEPAEGSAPSRSVWSLFVTGPVIREWGFHCANGWRPWQEFTDKRDRGAMGRGCD